MPTLFTFGFDYASMSVEEVAGAWSSGFSTGKTRVPGRSSGLALRCAAGSPSFSRTLSAEYRTVYLTFSIFLPALPPTDFQLITGTAAGTGHWNLLLKTDGTFSIRRQTLALGTSALAITTGAWHTVELTMQTGDASGNPATYGIGILKIDGVTFLNLTNVDTQNSGSHPGVDRLLFDGGRLATDPIDFDDGICSDTQTYPGSQILTLLPNAAGAYTQLSATGSPDNWSAVNETTSDSTTYVAGAASGLVDTYGLPNVVGNDGDIYLVRHFVVGRAVGGTATHRPAVAISGTVYDTGVDFSTGTSYAARGADWPTNPATAAPWTILAINDLQAGVKTTNATGQQFTQVGIELVCARSVTLASGGGGGGGSSSRARGYLVAL